MRDVFFNESLIDYLEASGQNVPESLLRGETPELFKGAHGKPYFSGNDLKGIFFSLSHTSGHEAVCFSRSEVGLDCENTEAKPGIEKRYKAIAKRCFTEDEQAYVDSGTDGALGRFFEVWTAKEAYMKYTGNGFSEGFRSFSVFNMPEVRFETNRFPKAPHVVYSVCAKR